MSSRRPSPLRHLDGTIHRREPSFHRLWRRCPTSAPLMGVTPAATRIPGTRTRPTIRARLCWLVWRAGTRPCCSARGWRQPQRCSRPCRVAPMSLHPSRCTGRFGSGCRIWRRGGGSFSIWSPMRTSTRCVLRCNPARPRSCGLRHHRIRPAPLRISLGRSMLRTAPAPRVVVDGTVATPVLCRPLELGADLGHAFGNQAAQRAF